MPIFSDKLLSRLPAEGRAKIERLDADRDAAHAAVLAASDAVQESRREHTLADAFAQQRLQAPRGYHVDLHPGAVALAEQAREQERDAEEARLMAPVEAAKRRLDAASAAHQRAVEVWERFAFLEDAAAWLERVGPGASFKHYAVPAPKSKNLTVDVEKIRAELLALEDAWHAAEVAPAPTADLLARGIAEIDELAARGEPTVYATTRGGSPVKVADAVRIGLTPHGQSVRLYGDAGARFWAWLLRDAMVEKVTELIEKLPDAGALSDEQREQEFARIAARRLELERIEESLVVAAEAQGQAIARRREADPRAILELIEV